ncbi:hypothetical protein diail_3332 [Diaporthe ilicicola]|nr:hypothetical protein diail_3332 [Diaporthe ilicicola]
MADEIPQGLKHADINLYKTATRAAQLSNVKPIIAYWCEYWIVNQILARNLHSTDADTLNYTTNLMDRLEKTKNEYANEDAIMDDATAQAYIEQFAQETLDRAERVIKANKVTQQTASTFDAALTFFNLVNIWGPPDTETQQKIKYAKWNAARITRAIKEGRDPNETNPKKEDLPPQQPDLDPTDPDVQALGSPSGQGHAPAPAQDQVPRAATVEDAPDPDLKRDSAGVSLPHTPTLPDPPASVPDDEELKLPSAPGYGNEAGAAVSPGYFDPPPTLPSPISPPTTHPTTYTPGGGAPSAPQTWTPTPPPASSSFAPPSAPSGPPTFAPSAPTTAAAAPPPTFSPPPADVVPRNVPPPASVPRPVVPAPTSLGSSGAAPATYTADDAAMSQAQKHAKWAISALNFEDVPTAVPFHSFFPLKKLFNMFARTNMTLLSLVGFLTLASALPSGPKETPPPSLEQRENSFRAYHAQKPRQASVTAGPDQLTITVVNKMAGAVSTSYVANAGVPGPVSGGTGTGTLTPGQTATLVAPQDWAGNVAVNLVEKDGKSFTMNGDVSLLEGSLMSWGDVGYRVDMDVSYVNGFSVPITCTCNADEAVLSGCSLDLWGMGSCSGGAGTDGGDGACANPLRPDNSARLAATDFFAPCEGAAFTWPRDGANSEGQCQSAEVTCCVGSTADGCPANPKQKGGSSSSSSSSSRSSSRSS